MFGGQPRSIDPPDPVSRFKMPDGSIVEVIRRYRGGPHGRAPTIFVEQMI